MAQSRAGPAMIQRAKRGKLLMHRKEENLQVQRRALLQPEGRPRASGHGAASLGRRRGGRLPRRPDGLAVLQPAAQRIIRLARGAALRQALAPAPRQRAPDKQRQSRGGSAHHRGAGGQAHEGRHVAAAVRRLPRWEEGPALGRYRGALWQAHCAAARLAVCLEHSRRAGAHLQSGGGVGGGWRGSGR